MMEDNPFDSLERLAPFMLKARAVEVGRDRLWQIRNKLAFLLVTTDLAENSREKLLKAFPCPIYQALTMEDIARLFGYQGTKVLGFRRSPLSTTAQRAFKGRMLPRPPVGEMPAAEKHFQDERVKKQVDN